MVRRRMWRSRRGQSVVEYLIIASAIIAAVVAIRVGFGGKTSEILQGSVDKTGESATYLKTIVSGAN